MLDDFQVVEYIFTHAQTHTQTDHTQVVHEAGSVLPDLRGGAAERFDANLLTPVEFLHCTHHHMDRIKQQGRRQLNTHIHSLV